MTGKGIVVAAVTVALIAASVLGDLGLVADKADQMAWDILSGWAIIGSALWVMFGKEGR